MARVQSLPHPVPGNHRGRPSSPRGVDGKPNEGYCAAQTSSRMRRGRATGPVTVSQSATSTRRASCQEVSVWTENGSTLLPGECLAR